ncbi:MAG: eCIS core domain-containing protein [Planctomycetota bacterium]|jgi:hypothetical protein
MSEFEKQKNRIRSGFLARSAGRDRSITKPVHDNNHLLAQQQTLGNQAMLRFAQSCPLRLPSASLCPTGGACHTCPAKVQAKLKIGQPGDKYEQEADRVADEVMRMPEPDLQRQLEPEEEEEEELLQAKEISGHTPEINSSIETKVKAVRSSGQPLPESVRTYFEPRFGYDFSQVRIHTDAGAAKSTQTVNAQAYTLGRDIIFGNDHYSPETTSGKHLLAHELTHVVQHNGEKGSSDIGRHIKQFTSFPSIHFTTITKEPSCRTDDVFVLLDAVDEARNRIRRIANRSARECLMEELADAEVICREGDGCGEEAIAYFGNTIYVYNWGDGCPSLPALIVHEIAHKCKFWESEKFAEACENEAFGGRGATPPGPGEGGGRCEL